MTPRQGHIHFTAVYTHTHSQPYTHSLTTMHTFTHNHTHSRSRPLTHTDSSFRPQKSENRRRGPPTVFVPGQRIFAVCACNGWFLGLVVVLFFEVKSHRVRCWSVFWFTFFVSTVSKSAHLTLMGISTQMYTHGFLATHEPSAYVFVRATSIGRKVSVSVEYSRAGRNTVCVCM